jgi:hypothetical protein
MSCLHDVYTLNTLIFTHANDNQRKAWERIRETLVEHGIIKCPILVIPDDLLDENGNIIPDKEHKS